MNLKREKKTINQSIKKTNFSFSISFILNNQNMHSSHPSKNLKNKKPNTYLYTYTLKHTQNRKIHLFHAEIGISESRKYPNPPHISLSLSFCCCSCSIRNQSLTYIHLHTSFAEKPNTIFQLN